MDNLEQQEIAEIIRLFMVEPPSAAPRAMAVDADQNARIHQMVAQGFNPDLVYAEAPPLNKRRSSAVNIDADLLLRMQAGPLFFNRGGYSLR